MIKPLTFRHPAFRGDIRDTHEALSHFTDLLDQGNDPNAPKSSWIRSIWFHDGSQPTELGAEAPIFRDKYRRAFTALPPRLTSLNELVCRQNITDEDFSMIARYHGSSTKNMRYILLMKPFPSPSRFYVNSPCYKVLL
jgi:hypothetical protein